MLPVFAPRIVTMTMGIPRIRLPLVPPLRSYSSTWSAVRDAGLGTYSPVSAMFWNVPSGRLFGALAPKQLVRWTERRSRGPARELAALAELGVHADPPVCAVHGEHRAGLGAVPGVIDQRHRSHVHEVEVPAEVDLGGLDGEGVRRPPAQVLEVEASGEVIAHESVGLRRLEPSVVETVRQHEHVGSEPVTADVRDLPRQTGCGSS